MQFFVRASLYVAAFITGVVIDWFLLQLIVQSTFSCPPADRVCDGPAFMFIILLIVTAPIVGLLLAAIVRAWFRPLNSIGRPKST